MWNSAPVMEKNEKCRRCCFTFDISVLASTLIYAPDYIRFSLANIKFNRQTRHHHRHLPSRGRRCRLRSSAP